MSEKTDLDFYDIQFLRGYLMSLEEAEMISEYEFSSIWDETKKYMEIIEQNNLKPKDYWPTRMLGAYGSDNYGKDRK